MSIKADENWLIPGAVIKVFTHNTEPPKFKRCVIIGLADPPTMVAVVYFNTVYPPSPFLEPYQIAFSGSEGFLEHDCYLDCAQLFEETEAWIRHEITNNREPALLGSLSENRLNEVLSMVKKAPTIRMKLKKKYGIC